MINAFLDRRFWLPELREIPPEQQAAALEDARRAPFDAIELAGMVFGLIAVTAITRYALPDTGLAARLGMFVANLLVALPLLALLLGPFHLRRLRRGLRTARQRRASG